ncbi:hypothetical protein [Nonomuraea sp. 10N515B]
MIAAILPHTMPKVLFSAAVGIKIGPYSHPPGRPSPGRVRLEVARR